MSAIQGIEGCGQLLSTAKGAHSLAQHSVVPEAAGALSAEMESLSILHLKCKGYLQSVNFIQDRVKVVIGLVSAAGRCAKNVLIAAPSSPMGSISRVNILRTESQTLVMH